MKKKGLISFSGGETSAYMSQWLLANKSKEYDFKVVFANTGQELEQTLEFVQQCDRLFNLNCTWIEADVQNGRGDGTKAKIVNFESANRTGYPFERVIAKYGIPNMAFPHCSRELKATPIRAYARSIGWGAGKYESFIGIRADEFDRASPKSGSDRLVYPLIKLGITKEDINSYWRDMPFRLQIKGYEGNCKTCWKKTNRKLMTIAKHNPEYFEFNQRMEQKYENHQPLGKDLYSLPARFFRKKLTTQQILDMAQSDFIEATDDRMKFESIYQPSLFDLDVSSGCEESCEAF